MVKCTLKRNVRVAIRRVLTNGNVCTLFGCIVIVSIRVKKKYPRV